MIQLLFLVHSALLLAFGIVVTFAFADILFNRENSFAGLIFFLLNGVVQLVVYALLNESYVQWLYPFITHLPLLLMLLFKYKRPLFSAIASIASAYLCCQPAKWFGLVFYSLTDSMIVSYLVQIAVLILTCGIAFLFFKSLISMILLQNDTNTFFFALVPIIYYVFDYLVGSSIGTWSVLMQTAVEFLPFFICVVYLIFSSVYYKENQQRIFAEKKEQIIQISVEQQNRELELMKSTMHEMRLLRHDMRLIFNQLAVSLQNNDTDNALKIISNYIDTIDSTQIIRYCGNEPVNYVLASYVQQCEKLNICFKTDIQLHHLNQDEIMISSLLSNALDNAINAVKELDEDRRIIQLMLKNSHDKLLISVRNHYLEAPVFVDGYPITTEKGHGYGTQSIRFITERLQGNLQFTLEDDWFVLRVVIQES